MNKFKTAILFVLGLTAAVLFSALPAGAQSGTVNIEAKDRTVEWILSELKTQSGYEIVFSDNFLDSKAKISISIRNASVEKAIGSICRKWNADFKIKGKTIILLSAKKPAKQEKAEEKTAKGKRRVVSGIVVDDGSEPVIGAVVMQQGTQNATETNLDGEFRIECPEGDLILFVSCLGYKEQSVRVFGASGNIRVTLRQDLKLLDEAVAIGYGSVKKSDLTGAVSSIRVDDGNVPSVTSVTNLLAGKAAGLQVSASGASPGAGSTFRIRGAASVNSNNDPLIIIDGFPVNPASDSKIETGSYSSGTSDNIFGSLNPNDIESIEVLKDASSTAIYGARAANGVIIVTTKKGASGAPKVTYSGSGGISVMAGEYDMLDAQGLMKESNRYGLELWKKQNGVGIYGGKDPEEVFDAYIPFYGDYAVEHPEYDTDYLKEISRLGYQTQHNLSVTGGSEYTKYLVSGSWFRQNGIIRNNDVTRATARINLDQKITSWMNLGVNLNLSRNTLHPVPLGESGIIKGAAKFTPLLPVKDEKGDYCLNEAYPKTPNPVSLLEISNVIKKNRVMGTAWLEIRPLKGLVLRGSAGIDANFQKHQVYIPKSTLTGALVGGRADQRQYDKNDLLVDFTATYTAEIGKHSLSAMAGYSWQRFGSEDFSAENEEFLIDGYLYNNLGAGNAVKPYVSSGASSYEMASFFGRLNWSYDRRYLATATLRADGSGRFAKNNRWGYFPSVALGWRFSKEPFFSPVSGWWSNGKLRLSFGQTGNAGINANLMNIYRNYNSDDSVPYNSLFGGTNYIGLVLSEIANPNLKWETTTEVNAGLDLGFFEDRLNITVEYFYKVISDLLQWRKLMRVSEVRYMADNIGKTQSRGFELSLNTVNVSTRDFSWTTDFTFSFYRDRWLERADSWAPAAYDRYNGWIRPWVTYLSDGLIKPGESNPAQSGAVVGQVKIKDINGYVRNPDGTYKVDEHGIPVLSGEPDGIINDADKVEIGTVDPGYIAGMNNTIKWKGFDFNIYFYGQFGLLNYGDYKQIFTVDATQLAGGQNYPKAVAKKFSDDNPGGEYPGYFQNESMYGIGDYFTTRSWFIRCRNITLGYTIPKQKHISNLRVYMDVNNPFMISPYKGLDLEMDTGGSFSYPNIRTFSLGLSITF